MQEEVENRTLTLVVSGTKFTGRLMKAAITKYLAHRKEKKLQKQKSRDTPVIPHGKQTVKQLIGQNQGVSNIEITDPSIKEFEKIARKYGVDYAVKKDRSSSPPKYLIFFKGRDADALTAAFTEYTGKKVKKAEKTERPSVLAKLNQFKELVKNAVVDRTKRKELALDCFMGRIRLLEIGAVVPETIAAIRVNGLQRTLINLPQQSAVRCAWERFRHLRRLGYISGECGGGIERTHSLPRGHLIPLAPICSSNNGVKIF